MKSQGLSLSFIVIAALAVLVLVVVAMFFFRGFRTEAVDVQTAINACSSKCLLETQIAKDATSPYSNSNSPFCSLVQSVKGVGDDLRCDKLTSCDIVLGDGTQCRLSCSGSTSTCQ